MSALARIFRRLDNDAPAASAGPERGHAKVTDQPQASPEMASASDRPLLDAYSRAVVGAVDAVSPSVAHIHAMGERRGRPVEGSGSGVIVSPDGLLLTNNHVIEGADRIKAVIGGDR